MREGMRLVFPTIEYKDKAIEYINEFYELSRHLANEKSFCEYVASKEKSQISIEKNKKANE